MVPHVRSPHGEGPPPGQSPRLLPTLLVCGVVEVIHEECKTEGPSCGVVLPVGVSPLPCIICAVLTVVRSACGAPRHHDCAPTPKPFYTFNMPERKMPPRLADQPSTYFTIEKSEPKWLGAQHAREKRGAQMGQLQPRLREELSERLDRAELDTAVTLWNETMRGIEYQGGHRTALAILNGTFKHHAIPALPPPDPAAMAPLADGPLWVAKEWAVQGAANGGDLDGNDLCSYDVNGMYLSAAARLELGTGALERAEWPSDEVLKHPGWVRVSTLEGAPWSIADRWEELMWMPTPIVAYLRDAGAQFLIAESLVWRQHRSALDPHVDLLRKTRSRLIEVDSPAAVELLDIVKDLYARMFGGLLASSDHNDSLTLRPDWKALIFATGQARMFRALDKTHQRAGVGVVGVYVDAVWFVMPPAFIHPPGLEISTQLGKWKTAGRTPWTQDLRAAWQDGRHKPLWKALDDAR